VAVRDAPKVAELCWTHPSPKGPKGRFDPGNPNFWAIWGFSANKGGSEELADASLAAHLGGAAGRREPWLRHTPFEKLHDFKTWEEEGPPKGTLYNYPPRGDVIASISGAPAPTRIGNQIFVQATMTKMIAHCTQGGQSIDKAMDWAASELEGFMRS
jgi:hypothetical protein